MSSNVSTDLTVDASVALSSSYQIDVRDRRFIDDQIQALQGQAVRGAIRGQTRTNFVLHPSSAALAPGDAFCAAGVFGAIATEDDATSALRYVTRATDAALADAGVALGIAAGVAAPGAFFSGATGGIVGPGLTGLAGALAGPVRIVNARCQRVAALESGDYPIGYADGGGNLTLGQGRAIASTDALRGIQPFSIVTGSPIAVYQLNGDYTDATGNLPDLIVVQGTPEWEDFWPGRVGVSLVASILGYGSNEPALTLRGDMYVIVNLQIVGSLSGSHTYIGHTADGGGVEIEGDNGLYQLICTVNRYLSYFSEHGAGVNDSFTSAGARFNGYFKHMQIGMTRINNVIQMYCNGRPLGAPSSALTAPTGGSNGRFTIGGTKTAALLSPHPASICGGVKIGDAVMLPADMMAEYNATFGPAFGEIS